MEDGEGAEGKKEKAVKEGVRTTQRRTNTNPVQGTHSTIPCCVLIDNESCIGFV